MSKLCHKMSSDCIKSVTFSVNFHCDAYSEHTSVQSIRRFRAYVGSEHTPIQRPIFSEHTSIQRPIFSEHTPVQRPVGSKHTPVQGPIFSEHTLFQRTVSSKHTPLKALNLLKTLRFELNKTQDYLYLILF